MHHLATIDEGYFSGVCHAEGRCAGSRTPFSIPVEESFQGTMKDILPECCLSAVPRGREFPVHVFFFFRPECPLQPCRSVGAGDPREPSASKLPRSDPHSAFAKSPPPERPSGPAVLGLVFGPFFHPTKKRSIWRFRRSDWHSAGNLTLFAIRAEEPIQGTLRHVSTRASFLCGLSWMRMAAFSASSLSKNRLN